jgi:hypothetical protein
MGMEPTELLPAVALLLLIGVEFGGWSLLWFITSKRDFMDERRIQFFRAGHAHGGVLTILSLVYLLYLERTDFSEGLQWLLGVGLIVGALAQSGGFFVHLSKGAPDSSSLGTILTRTGAVLIGAALIALAIGLL